MQRAARHVIVAWAVLSSACPQAKENRKLDQDRPDQSKEPESKPSEPGAGSGGWDEPSGDLHFALTPRKLITVEDQHGLMAMVVTLRDRGASTLRCTAMPVADNVVLTAAHCIAGRRAVEIAGHGPIATHDDARACVGDLCSDKPVQPRQDVLGFARTDLATAVVDVAPPMRAPEVEFAAMPGFGRMPDLYVISNLRPGPMLVCSAEIVVGTGIADGEVVEGDSGSPLVVVEPIEGGHRRTVVGVISARAKDGATFYFAALPFELPWPQRARAEARPVVDVRYELESRDPRCHGGN